MGDSVIKIAKSEYGKGSKNIKRSGRLRSRTISERPAKIVRSRKAHLKNARQSCGEAFADQLQRYYAKNYSPGKKCG